MYSRPSNPKTTLLDHMALQVQKKLLSEAGWTRSEIMKRKKKKPSIQTSRHTHLLRSNLKPSTRKRAAAIATSQNSRSTPTPRSRLRSTSKVNSRKKPNSPQTTRNRNSDNDAEFDPRPTKLVSAARDADLVHSGEIYLRSSSKVNHIHCI
jgi:hypothetical protein